MKPKYYYTEGRKLRVKNPFYVSARGDDGKWSVVCKVNDFEGWHQTLQERIDWLFAEVPEFQELHKTKKTAQTFVDLAWSKYIEGMVKHGLAYSIP